MLLAIRSRRAALEVEARCLDVRAIRATVAVSFHHTVVRMLFAVRRCHGSRDVGCRFLHSRAI